MRKTIPIIILLLLVLISASSAYYQTSVLHAGITPAAQYYQTGEGIYNLSTVPQTITRTVTTLVGQPIVFNLSDVNYVMYQDATVIHIMKVDSAHLLLTDVATYNIGVNIGAAPAALRRDDTSYYIMIANSTHYSKLVFYDNASIQVLRNVSKSGSSAYQYHNVQCSSGTFRDSDYHCIFSYVTAGQETLLNYNVLNDTVTSVDPAVQRQMTNRSNYAFSDINLDGYQEVIFRLSGDVTGNQRYGWIYLGNINASGSISLSLIYSMDTTRNDLGSMTDILVTDVDGIPGSEISFGYTTDGTNFYVRTIDYTGTVLESSYFTALSAPEGNGAIAMTRNMAAIPVCVGNSNAEIGMIVRAVNNDTQLVCVSLYGGKSTRIYNLGFKQYWANAANPERRLTGATMFSDTSYTDVIIGGTIASFENSKHISAASDVYNAFLPVDLERKGFNEMIAYNPSSIAYITTGLANPAPSITLFKYYTGNPVCNNTIERYDIVVTDESVNDFICNLSIKYANGTLAYNASSVKAPGSVNTFNYRYIEVDTYTVTAVCYDEFGSDTKTYTASVSNGATCNTFGIGGQELTFATTAAANANAEFQANIDNALEDVGLLSGTAKTIFALLLIIGSAVVVFQMTKSAAIAGLAALVFLLISFYIGFVSYIPILLLCIAGVAAITYFIFKRG